MDLAIWFFIFVATIIVVAFLFSKPVDDSELLPREDRSGGYSVLKRKYTMPAKDDDITDPNSLINQVMDDMDDEEGL